MLTGELNGIELLARAIAIGGTLLLVGSLPVTVLVVRSLDAAARGDADRALARLRVVLRVAAAAVAAAALLSLWRLADVFGGAAGASAGGLAEVLASDLGGWTVARLVLAVALWFVVGGAVAAPGPAGWLGWAVTAGALVLTVSMTGHARSAGAAAVAVDVLHLAAGAVWLAGVVALAVVVPAAIRSVGAARRRATLLGCAVGFSRLAVLAVAVTVLTGFAHGLRAGIRPQDLAGTAWGTVATAKLLLMVAVVAAGALNHRVLLRRLAAASSRTSVRAGATALLSTVSLEVVLGVAMVIVAAALVSVPQP